MSTITNNFIYDLNNIEEVLKIQELLKDVYIKIKNDKVFRVSPEVVQINDSNYDIIKGDIPVLENFRKKYSLSTFLLFLEFNASDGEVVYEQNPHSHNTNTDGSIFFPIKYSPYIRTNFYRPPKNFIKDVNFSDNRYHTIKECIWKVPCASYDIKYPVVFNINEFHQPVEIESNILNLQRVVCNWRASINFKDLVRLFT